VWTGRALLGQHVDATGGCLRGGHAATLGLARGALGRGDPLLLDIVAVIRSIPDDLDLRAVRHMLEEDGCELARQTNAAMRGRLSWPWDGAGV
jgi:hypothetical protein